jgi:lysyl-tRNA synthetase, class II
LTLLEGDRYTAARLCERIVFAHGCGRRKEVDPLEFEPQDQFQQRLKNLGEIEGLGHAAYPRKFAWTHTAKEVGEKFGERTAEQLTAEPVEVRAAGRIVALRPHGKAAFAHIAGGGGRLQIYVRQDVVGEEAYKLFKLLDLGDIVGVSGHLFRTKTNELSVKVEKIELLSKALLPLPEKWHGLADIEQRYRRRYLDLIVNEGAREIFIRRAQIIREIRHFFDARGYSEVETPMMHPILGGATARPFVTHHNTFDMDLYLRIAPELYLKRLVVGGIDRVYEINRNFRNEGIDAIHQPEFTMLEFYQAYSDYLELMDMTEELFRGLAEKVTGSAQIKYGEQTIDFGRFERLSMQEAICRYCPEGAEAKEADFKSKDAMGNLLQRVMQEIEKQINLYRGDRIQPWEYESESPAHKLSIQKATLHEILRSLESEPLGKAIGDFFEVVAEEHLIQPTFIYDFPTAISPLSKQKPDDPSLTERFELFVAGMELANGFSELNDPFDQERRFRAQVEKGGQEAPKEVDMDYIRALAHGLPPTAGEGVGIDRLVMLLTDSHAIREVVLFPLLRAESPDARSDDGATPAPDGGSDSGGGKA